MNSEQQTKALHRLLVQIVNKVYHVLSDIRLVLMFLLYTFSDEQSAQEEFN